MTTSRRSVLGLAGVLALGGAATPSSGASWRKEFESVLAQQDFSGTVLASRNAGPVISRSYGMANRELAIPNGAGTIFALASVTKIFTAVAIAQLAQREKVRFGDPVNRYLSWVPAEVRLHHLLTHTSGFGDYLETPGFGETARGWRSVKEVWDGSMAVIQRSTLEFTPGARMRYSNSGYHVLGAVVAAVTGASYYDYVRDNIFRPARMDTADFYTSTQWRDDRRIARPYRSAERIDDLPNKLFIGSPAGDSFASCVDLTRFAHSLRNGTLLSPAFAALTLAGKLPVGGPGFLAYGPIASILNGHNVIEISGGSPGESTALLMFPDDDWTVVLLSNQDPGAMMPIADRARRLITA